MKFKKKRFYELYIIIIASLWLTSIIFIWNINHSDLTSAILALLPVPIYFVLRWIIKGFEKIIININVLSTKIKLND